MMDARTEILDRIRRASADITETDPHVRARMRRSRVINAIGLTMTGIVLVVVAIFATRAICSIGIGGCGNCPPSSEISRMRSTRSPAALSTAQVASTSAAL